MNNTNKMNWNRESVLTVINTVLQFGSMEDTELNKGLMEHLGASRSSIECSRVSISRCLQGFEPSSKKGDLRGYNFGKVFTETVNEWYSNYNGMTSKKALSYKF